MNVGLVLTGLVLIGIGAAMAAFPHGVRNFVGSREWQEHPERAGRKQERRARAVGGLIGFGLGCPTLLAGLTL
ncbi:hypothetical protein ACFR97_04415 [Haloplanus litoreus]|uniref:Uncharacterized protein n=1 Tax=Haloplanus litoreus TaxID=767515 RepID=A0ABD6A054_9EURY